MLVQASDIWDNFCLRGVPQDCETGVWKSKRRGVVLVWGLSKEQHDARLKQVLELARAKNPKLNRDKCKIGLEEVKYLGLILSKDGLKPDQNRGDQKYAYSKMQERCGKIPRGDDISWEVYSTHVRPHSTREDSLRMMLYSTGTTDMRRHLPNWKQCWQKYRYWDTIMSTYLSGSAWILQRVD